MKKIVIPKKGVKVRLPISGFHIPEEGQAVHIDAYINRRIADGDLTIGTPPAKIIKSQKKTDGDK